MSEQNNLLRKTRMVRQKMRSLHEIHKIYKCEGIKEMNRVGDFDYEAAASFGRA
jgi:predicted alpha/beta-fold hydrolase